MLTDNSPKYTSVSMWMFSVCVQLNTHSLSKYTAFNIVCENWAVRIYYPDDKM